jgi:hypothetical protein
VFSLMLQQSKFGPGLCVQQTVLVGAIAQRKPE